MPRPSATQFDVTTRRISQKNDMLLLSSLLTYIKPHMGKLAIGVMALIITLGVELIRPIIIRYVIDEGFVHKDFHIILLCAMAYIISIALSFIFMFLQNYLLERFGQTIILELRNIVFSKILHKRVNDFESIPTGNWVTRITNDIESLRTLYTDVLIKLGSNIVFIFGILGAMYYLNVYLALVMTAIVPIMGVIIFVYQKFSRKAFRGVRLELAASNSSVQEILNFIVTIKTYVAENYISHYYDEVSKRYLQAGLQEVKTFAIFRPIVDGLFFVAIIAVFSFTNYFDSVTDAGVVFAFIQYMDKFFQPLKEIAEKYNSLQSSLAGGERLVPLLQETSTSRNDVIEVPKELASVHSIELEHVYFSYDDSENYVLEDISMTIQGGEFIGIVGVSGAGKSTLLSLLMGLYQPTKGRILINHIDIKNYDGVVLREVIGYVFQSAHLFKGTIRENISLYDDAITYDKIIAATDKVGLHSMIIKLPEGYDTPVGYLGSLLSSGEKQLLAFARTLLKEKPVLLLDEATSNVDSQTEQKIQDSIASIRGDKTVISIAHRISTIQDADCIYVLEKGKLVESGSYQSLIQQKGLFYDLWAHR